MYGDDIIYDTTPETIVGPQLGEKEPYVVELIPGDRYRINYGIHQGIFRYEGKVKDNATNRKNHPHSIGECLFRDEQTGKLSFGYYPHVSPCEFTRICTKIH